MTCITFARYKLLLTSGSHRVINGLIKLFAKNYKNNLKQFLGKTPACAFHCSTKCENFYKFTQKPIKYSDPAFSHSVLKGMLQKCDSVSEQIEIFHSYVKLTEESIGKRMSLCHIIENIFKSSFPDCTLHLVGSSVNGLGLGGCDVDLTFQPSHDYKCAPSGTKLISNVDVSSDKVSISEFSSLTHKQQLLLLRRMLQRSGIVETVSVIPGRIPILNFQYNGLGCDLSINNRSALDGTNFMKLCVNMDKRVTLLFHLIIYWSKRSKLVGGPMKFKSYSIFLMVVYFLQTRHPPILPPIQDVFLKTGFLKNLDHYSKDVSQYEGSFQSTNSESLEVLLREFFSFYTSFDFSSVICTLEANLVDNKTFVLEQPNFELNTISIQDPLNLSWNVTTGANWKYCKGFIKALLSACDIYHENPQKPTMDKNWGIISLLDCPLADDSFATRQNVHIEVPLNTLTKAESDRTECFRVAAERIFGVLKDGLLFQCDPLESTNLQHTPKLDSVSKTYSNYKCLNQSDRNVSEVNNKTVNDSDTLPTFSAMCVASDTWLNRSNYSYQKHQSEQEKGFLENEQHISTEILKNRKVKEDKEDFYFICECNGFYKNNNAYLNVCMKSVNRNIFIPKLGIFLKEYIIKYALKYL